MANCNLLLALGMMIHLQSMIMSRPATIQKQVCFSDPPIGCFSTDYPFNNTDKLPQSPEQIDVRYYHTVKDNRDSFHWKTATLIMRSRFRPHLKTVIIVHGFREKGTKQWVLDMVEELTKLKDPVNIIVLDWKDGADVGYSQATANIRVVAAMGALFVEDLIDLGADPASIHIIGNSLGAHLAGQMASKIPGLGRVSGLDPAIESVEGFPPEVKLDRTDAKVVDVLHTDVKKPFGFGVKSPMGTVDFYANGALHQPGCYGPVWSLVLFVVGMEKCSHDRANQLFTDSIATSVMMAGECSSVDHIINGQCKGCQKGKPCIPYGYHLNYNDHQRRLYAFNTNSKSPFGTITRKLCNVIDS